MSAENEELGRICKAVQPVQLAMTCMVISKHRADDMDFERLRNTSESAAQC